MSFFPLAMRCSARMLSTVRYAMPLAVLLVSAAGTARTLTLGDVLGVELPSNLHFVRQDGVTDAFVRFAATDSKGRTHRLVDYAHACRTNPDIDEFEVFIPCEQ